MKVGLVLWRARWLVLPCILCSAPAAACSLVSVEASMARAVADSGKYLIASIVVGCALISLEFYLGRRWLFPILTAMLLVFHPFWTLPPFLGPDCVFHNVEASGVILVVLCLMCMYRLVSDGLTRRQRTATVVAAIVGALAAVTLGAVVVASFAWWQHGLTEFTLRLRHFLPWYVPWAFLAGIAPAFAIALALRAVKLLKRLAHG
jgi:hypothetical protein